MKIGLTLCEEAPEAGAGAGAESSELAGVLRFYRDMCKHTFNKYSTPHLCRFLSSLRDNRHGGFGQRRVGRNHCLRGLVN